MCRVYEMLLTSVKVPSISKTYASLSLSHTHIHSLTHIHTQKNMQTPLCLPKEECSTCVNICPTFTWKHWKC